MSTHKVHKRVYIFDIPRHVSNEFPNSAQTEGSCLGHKSHLNNIPPDIELKPGIDLQLTAIEFNGISLSVFLYALKKASICKYLY